MPESKRTSSVVRSASPRTSSVAAGLRLSMPSVTSPRPSAGSLTPTEPVWQSGGRPAGRPACSSRLPSSTGSVKPSAAPSFSDGRLPGCRQSDTPPGLVLDPPALALPHPDLLDLDQRIERRPQLFPRLAAMPEPALDLPPCHPLPPVAWPSEIAQHRVCHRQAPGCCRLADGTL